jgi:hypothetical protein
MPLVVQTYEKSGFFTEIKKMKKVVGIWERNEEHR